MIKDPEECEIFCRECNGYLWSVSTHESGGQDFLLVNCPMLKDPMGKCTGSLRKQFSSGNKPKY